MSNPVLKPQRSICPIAATLDLVGDKWSLILVRDLMIGKSRFNEFLESSEGITTNILTNRLRRMEETGLIARDLYQEHPPRYAYRLTRRGRKLLPILQDMCRWANEFVDGTWRPPESFMDMKFED